MSVGGPDVIRTGFFATFTATATMSDGTTQTVTPTWSSSNTGVAQVDAAGRVDGRTHGTAVVTATYQGRTATRTLTIVQNYGGQWRGTYQMHACDNSGVFAQAKWCQELGGVGAALGFTLSLNQTGNGRDQISGVLDLGDFPVNVSGTVTSDGRLVIGGTSNVSSGGLTFSVTIGGWDTRAAAGDTMTGSRAQNLTAVNVPGNAYMENRIQAISHVTQQVSASPAASVLHFDLPGIIDRMRQR